MTKASLGPPVLVLLLLLLLIFPAPPTARASSFGALRASVFKIQVSYSEPSLVDPWKKLGSKSASGSGFYIGNGRILTNAHVVANATYVSVLRDGSAEPAVASVEVIGHDCDLALLTVDDPEVLAGLTPLDLGPLPKLRSPVSTIGYPLGGDQISVTDGIVSRLSYRHYVHHGSARHLMVQVDSAINPGNSGGPVVQGRQVVGVAFQTYTGAAGTGYIIPTPVVRRFLRASERGPYAQFQHTDDGLTTSEGRMLNPSAEAYAGLKPRTGGVPIVHVAEWAPTAGLLQASDVLLALDDQPVGVDGKITFEGERVDFRALFDLKQIGETARFLVERQGRPLEVEVPVVLTRPHQLAENVYATHAPYFVYGGLVFTTLTRSFLKTWGDNWQKAAPLLLRYLDEFARFEPGFRGAQDIVVLAKRLPDQVNAYAVNNVDDVVESVDGLPIKGLAQLTDALPNGKAEFAVIKFVGSHEPLVLARAKVKERNDRILQKYGVHPDRWLARPGDDGAIHPEAEAAAPPAVGSTAASPAAAVPGAKP